MTYDSEKVEACVNELLTADTGVVAQAFNGEPHTLHNDMSHAMLVNYVQCALDDHGPELMEAAAGIVSRDLGDSPVGGLEPYMAAFIITNEWTHVDADIDLIYDRFHDRMFEDIDNTFVDYRSFGLEGHQQQEVTHEDGWVGAHYDYDSVLVDRRGNALTGNERNILALNDYINSESGIDGFAKIGDILGDDLLDYYRHTHCEYNHDGTYFQPSRATGVDRDGNSTYPTFMLTVDLHNCDDDNGQYIYPAEWAYIGECRHGENLAVSGKAAREWDESHGGLEQTGTKAEKDRTCGLQDILGTARDASTALASSQGHGAVERSTTGR